jgi:hypothetical protein
MHLEAAAVQREELDDVYGHDDSQRGSEAADTLG